MGSSAGRRDAEYVRTRTLYQAGATCWMCGTYGRMTVDHDPPMHTVGGPTIWNTMHRQGKARYLPACQPCQSRQGANLRNHTRTWRL